MSLYEKIDELFAPVASGLDNNEAIVTEAYESLLGYADASEMSQSAARIAYWVEKLDSGELTEETFGGAFLEEASTNQGNLISDEIFANNKTAVEAHESAYADNADRTIEEFATIAADTRPAEEASDDDSGTPGETFTLTTGSDDFTGTDLDDTFEATNKTLSTTDSIDGGDGVDTLKIDDSDGSSESGLTAASVTNVEKLDVTASAGVGREAGTSTAQSGQAEVETLTIDANSSNTAVTDIVLTVGDVTHSVSSLTVDSTSDSAIHSAVKALIESSLGGGVSVSGVTDSEFTVTGDALGTDIPDFSVDLFTGDGTSTASTSTVTREETQSAEERITTSGEAQSAIQTIKVAVTSGNADDVYSVTVDGVTVAAYTGDNSSNAAVAPMAAQINALYGSDIATAVGDTITIKGPEGEPLPLIGADAADGNVDSDVTFTNTLVQNSTQVDAPAASTVQYDATGFTNEAKASAQSDINIKAADTANADLSTSSGSVRLEGGLTADITATDEIIVEGNELTDVTAETGTASGDTVTIGATSGTTDDTPKLESATVTGGASVDITDNTDGTSAKTLTTVTLNEIGDTATLTGDAIATVNLGAQTTSQTVDVVNGTSNHNLDISLADTGIAADGTSETVTADVDAKTVDITSNGTKNDLQLNGNSGSVTGVTVAGAGALALALDSSSTEVASLDGSAATGDLTLTGLEAAAVTVKTGSGDDSFTTAATNKMTVDAGGGDDAVTLGAALAKGSTVDLGAGNDRLLNNSGGVDTDDSTDVTVIDGGSGTDVISSALVTNGNADQFTNFEVLGLDDSSLSAGLLTNSSISGLELLAAGGTYTGISTQQALEVGGVDLSGETTLTFDDVSGEADNYQISFTGDNSSSSSAPTSKTYDASIITAAGIETYDLVSGGENAWNEITIGANSDAETINVTGSQNLNIKFDGTVGSTSGDATGFSNLNAGSFTGDLDVDYTGGTVNASADGITTVLGSGDDTVTTLGVENTINGGGGSNTYKVADNTGLDAIVSITDATADDVIDFNDLDDGSTTEVDVSGASTLEAAVGLADGTEDEVDVFDFGGDTYLVLAGGSTSSVNDDTIVKLVGGFDLTNASFDSSANTVDLG